MPVSFFDGPADDEALICLVDTETVLDPGHCEFVTCSWTEPPWDDPRDVYIVADQASDDGELVECHEQNNTSVISGVTCETK